MAFVHRTLSCNCRKASISLSLCNFDPTRPNLRLFNCLRVSNWKCPGTRFSTLESHPSLQKSTYISSLSSLSSYLCLKHPSVYPSVRNPTSPSVYNLNMIRPPICRMRLGLVRDSDRSPSSSVPFRSVGRITRGGLNRNLIRNLFAILVFALLGGRMICFESENY